MPNLLSRDKRTSLWRMANS